HGQSRSTKEDTWPDGHEKTARKPPDTRRDRLVRRGSANTVRSATPPTSSSPLSRIPTISPCPTYGGGATRRRTATKSLLPIGGGSGSGRRSFGSVVTRIVT